MKTDILAKEIDTTQIKQIQDRIEHNSKLIDEIVSKLVSDYCKKLDDYVAFIQNVLQDIDHPPTDLELDDFVMNLPVLLFFVGQGQESLGIKLDTARAIKQEKYNSIYNNLPKGTINDKQSQAELEVQEEEVVRIAYDRAYKIIKYKLEMGNELLQSVKKVISRRTAEISLSSVKIDDVTINSRHY